MGVADKMFDAITRVIRMDAKVEEFASTVKDQQARIEDLTKRIIRLETALDITLVTSVFKPSTNRIEKK